MLCLGLIAIPFGKTYTQSAYTTNGESPHRQNPQGSQESQASRSSQPQLVTLIVRDSSLGYSLRALAAQAKRQIVYDDANPEFAKRVNVRIVKRGLMEALATLLHGSGLAATIAPDGETIVIRPLNTRDTIGVRNGSIVVSVADSGSNNPIQGATVSLAGTTTIGTTDIHGKVTLSNVTPGAYSVTVKLLGYKSATRSIVLEQRKTLSVNIPLRPSATQLSGIVTTATGEQRKVEVGNDITVVHADSIVRTMPVKNLSDLLANRVPGLYAAPTSGNPGAPTRIRIRGLSSASESNDPIIIVDGIRVASDQMQSSGNMALGLSPGGQNNAYLVSSPLDMIDVNSIGTVEVLKGPSAVALYGSDAANGVIVVTTKRGQVGAPRLRMSAKVGTETIPGKWPVNYHMWGHSSFDPFTAIACNLEKQAQGQCVADSLATYQILNDPRRTVLGRGTSQSYHVEVSGGNRGMTYSLGGSISNIIGVVKLPDVDRALLIAAGQSVPNWLRHPESNMARSGSLNLSTDIGQYSVASFRSQLLHNATQGSPLRNALTWARGGSPPVDSVSSGLLAGIPSYRTRIGSQSLKSTNSLDLLSRFGSRLVTQFTGGADVTSRNDLATLGAGECFVTNADCLNDGMYNAGQGAVSVMSINARATAPAQLGNIASFKSTIGVNYIRETSRELIMTAGGLPVGATSSMGAARSTQLQNHRDRITAGMFVETVVGIANRWYFPLAIRQDAGSALGANFKPKFPKLAVSYILSDDDWFTSLPGAGVVSMFRLRAAYGQAGVQPAVSHKERNYLQTSLSVGGTSIPVIEIGNIGNTFLRPERTKEYEGGFELDVFNDRISTVVTFYRKNTNDMLTDVTTPPSIAGGKVQQVNLGDVTNSGLEVSATIIPIDSKIATMINSAQFSLNRNRLKRFGQLQAGSGIPKSSTNSGFAIGYPLHGYWTRPLLGVVDINDDGVISTGEYVLGDSAIYLGAPYPKYTISSNHSVTVMRRLSITGMLSYQNGLTQYRSERAISIRGYSDPQTPLVLQATTLYSDLNKIQTVSVVRFDALSIGYDIPKNATSRLLYNRQLRVSLQATNVGLWTNYRGFDPNVNSSMTEYNQDYGAVPKPRTWQLSVGIN